MKSTTARGLGHQHQQIRKRLIAAHVDGSPCWWCGGPMYRDADQNFDNAVLEADHTLSRANGGQHADRLLHMTCNRQRQDGSRDHMRPALAGAQPTEPSTDDVRVMAWPW